MPYKNPEDGRRRARRRYQEDKAYSYSRKRIEEEVKKCDILCANCHRKLHCED